MKIKEISWEETISIRQNVLWPNKPKEFCYIVGDAEGWHFGVYVESTLVSVASVYKTENGVRLRKFATLEEYQKRGIGSALLNHILVFVKLRDAKYFWCDARVSSIDFYKKFGMRTEGGVFHKSEIPYYKMSIEIT